MRLQEDSRGGWLRGVSFDCGMLMKNTKLIVRDHDTGEIAPLSPSERRMLWDRMKNADNPVRYIVASELIPLKRYFYYIASDNTYGLEIDQASQFKRRDIAGAVCNMLNGNRSHERHLVVKITTRNNSIRVLQYHLEDSRTTGLVRMRCRAPHSPDARPK